MLSSEYLHCHVKNSKSSTMFPAQLLWTGRWCLRTRQPQFSVNGTQISRLFSSTPITGAGYKMKSHSGAKKRWRSLASGSSFKRVRESYFMRKSFSYLCISNRQRLFIHIWTSPKALHKKIDWARLPIQILLRRTSWKNCFFLMVHINEVINV